MVNPEDNTVRGSDHSHLVDPAYSGVFVEDVYGPEKLQIPENRVDYLGKNVAWYTDKPERAEVFEAEYITSTPGNEFNQGKFNALFNSFNRAAYSPDPNAFLFLPMPWGYVSQITLADVAETQNAARQGRIGTVLEPGTDYVLDRAWTTGEDEVDEFLADPEEFVEIHEEVYADDLEGRSLQDYMVEWANRLAEEGSGDLGERVVQLEGGNHRAFSAIASGENRIWVEILNLQDYPPTVSGARYQGPFPYPKTQMEGTERQVIPVQNWRRLQQPCSPPPDPHYPTPGSREIVRLYLEELPKYQLIACVLMGAEVIRNLVSTAQIHLFSTTPPNTLQEFAIELLGRTRQWVNGHSALWELDDYLDAAEDRIIRVRAAITDESTPENYALRALASFIDVLDDYRELTRPYVHSEAAIHGSWVVFEAGEAAYTGDLVNSSYDFYRWWWNECQCEFPISDVFTAEISSDETDAWTVFRRDVDTLAGEVEANSWHARGYELMDLDVTLAGSVRIRPDVAEGDPEQAVLEIIEEDWPFVIRNAVQGWTFVRDNSTTPEISVVLTDQQSHTYNVTFYRSYRFEREEYDETEHPDYPY